MRNNQTRIRRANTVTLQTSQNWHEARNRSGSTNHSSYGNAAKHKSSLPLSYLMYHSILHIAVRVDLQKSEKYNE